MEQVIYEHPTKRTSAFDHPLYVFLLEKYFRPMQRGQLQIQLPSGKRLLFGKHSHELSAELRIHSSEFFRKCVLYGDIGFGEAYVDGDWDSPNVTNVIRWMILNMENNAGMSGSTRRFPAMNLLKPINRLLHLVRRNSRGGSRRNIEEHYDLSNDFFREFLDPSMVYSSAYFEREDVKLEEAQREKMDRLCRKLQLDSSHHVLEIGCGWGSFAMHAVHQYGCRVTAITISPKQYELALRRVKEAGLQNRVEIRLQDYRSLTGEYDRIVSVEMLEAVGREFLPVFFRKCHEVLKKSGVLGFQVITSPDSRFERFHQHVDWIQKHIFPGSLIPSIAALNSAVHKTGDLVLRNLEDFGTHYARTLALWRDRFEQRIDRIRSLGFDEKFRRKWNYYLSYCEAAFAMRYVSVVQMVYSRANNPLY